MSRNVFENNEESESGEKIYTRLPRLEEGLRYELAKLSNGSYAVVIVGEDPRNNPKE